MQLTATSGKPTRTTQAIGVGVAQHRMGGLWEHLQKGMLTNLTAFQMLNATG